MKYEEVLPLLKQGKIGMLPHYEGYFHWSWGLNKLWFENKDYVKLEEDLSEEKKREDWFI